MAAIDIDFAISSRDWRISKWGAGMKAISGFSSAEVIGRKVLDLFTMDVHDIFTEKIRRASEGKGLQYFRISLFTKNAEELDVFMYGRREGTYDEADIAILGGIIPSTIPASVCRTPLTIGVDLEGNVTLWDEAAEEITGMSSKLVLGKHFLDYFMTENFGAKAYMAAQMKRSMAGEHVGEFMVPIFTLAGELKIVELSASPGSAGGVVLTGDTPKASKRGLCKLTEDGTADTLSTIAPSSEFLNFAMFDSSEIHGFHAMSSSDLCRLQPADIKKKRRDMFKSAD